MTERRHKKAVRSARKCENLLDRQRGGNKNGYKWRKSVRCRLDRGSRQGRKVLSDKCSNINGFKPPLEKFRGGFFISPFSLHLSVDF